jgi:hypothetical protein
VTQEEIDAIASGMGSVPSVDIDAEAAAAGAIASPAAAPSVGQVALDAVKQLPQNLGVAAGAAIEGIASPVMLVMNPVQRLVNMLLPDNLKGMEPSQALHTLLTIAGVPEPETKMQEILRDTSAALAATGAGVGIGRGIVGLASSGGPGKMMAPLSKAAGIGGAMSSFPASQGIGAAVDAISSGAAEAAGVPPLAATGIGLVSGGFAGAASAGKSASGMARAAQATATSAEDAKTVGKLVKLAAKGNPFAKKRLAEMAKYNPEAAAAANDLGVDLPPDVFSDNYQMKSAAGLTRGVAGSEAEAGWHDVVQKAGEQADLAIEGLGADYVNGRPSPNMVSSVTKINLSKARDDLEALAAQLSDEVNAAVPKSSPASTENLKAYLQQVAEELGGEDKLSAYEKKLLAMVKDPNTTYGYLDRERKVVGENVGKIKGDLFGDTDTAALKQVYAAMAQDRLDTVEVLGSPELAEKLARSNELFAKKFELQDKIVDAFGRSGGGDIATDLTGAIKKAILGSNEYLNRILDIIPPDLHKEAIATALGETFRAGSGAGRGGFGFAEFSAAFPRLYANREGYKAIVQALGPESEKMLQSLYVVSKRLTEARALVYSTGKANQALLSGMTAENVVEKILGNTVGKSLATTGGALAAGPAGAGLVTMVSNALANGAKSKINKAGDLFRSPAFQKLVTELAVSGAPNEGSVYGVSNSKEFIEFAKAAKIEDRFKWLMGAISAKTIAETDDYQPISRSDGAPR